MNKKQNITKRYVHPERPKVRKGYKYINDCLCGGHVRCLHPRHRGKLICVDCGKVISSDWIEISN